MNIWQWLKGIWTSFVRWCKRTVNPRKKTNILFTPIRLWSRRTVTNSVGLWQDCHPDVKIKTVIGIENLRNAEFLPIEHLMSQVHWKLPKASRASVTNEVTIGSVKSEIQWD